MGVRTKLGRKILGRLVLDGADDRAIEREKANDPKVGTGSVSNRYTPSA
jgi:hypothetical protein